jgi:hypothetical protein
MPPQFLPDGTILIDDEDGLPLLELFEEIARNNRRRREAAAQDSARSAIADKRKTA